MIRDRISMCRLEHLLVTHDDEDHFDPSYLRYRKIVLSDRSALRPVTIYGSPLIRERIASQLQNFDRFKLLFQEVRAFVPLRMGEIEVFPLLGYHSASTLNYILAHGGRSVLVAWDTGYWREETWAAVGAFRLDAVLMECTLLGPGEIPADSKHLNFATMKQMRERLTDLGCITPATPFVAAHIGDNGQLTYDEAVAFASPHGITVSYDGFELSV